MNLRFENTKLVYPSIDYNGGEVWVDEKANCDYKQRQLCYVINRKEVVEYMALIGVKPNHDNVKPIIAQTPDLNLEGVPVVEVKDVDLKQEVLKFIQHWELYFSSPKVGQPPSLQILKDAVDKAAQSKGTYTEEQVIETIRLAQGTDLMTDEILASIQPEIVVETSSDIFNTKFVPITFQKEGRTYFKIKQ